MPRLVHDAVRVGARIAHREAEALRVVAQPGEGGRAFERFLGGRFVEGADVERAAGMVFAVAGRGVDGEDLVDGEPTRALALENAELIVVAAVAGDRLQYDIVAQRGRLHV